MSKTEQMECENVRLHRLNDATYSQLRCLLASLERSPSPAVKDEARHFAYFVRNSGIIDLLKAGDLTGPFTCEPFAVDRLCDRVLDLSHPMSMPVKGELDKDQLSRIERKIETLAFGVGLCLKRYTVPSAVVR